MKISCVQSIFAASAGVATPIVFICFNCFFHVFLDGESNPLRLVNNSI